MGPIECKGVFGGHQPCEGRIALLGLLGSAVKGGLLRGHGLGLCCRVAVEVGVVMDDGKTFLHWIWI